MAILFESAVLAVNVWLKKTNNNVCLKTTTVYKRMKSLCYFIKNVVKLKRQD